MAMTRGELKGKVLRLLMKNAQFSGPYEDDTINDAIEEARDFIAAEMFEANEGWMLNIRFLDTTPNQFLVDIPAGVAMIQDVRYLVGNVYMPLLYDDQSKQPQYGVSSGPVQYPYTYKLVGNQIYFNPPLTDGGEKFLQLDCMEYPKVMQDDADFMESQFDKSMEHFMKYKVATILGVGLEKFAMPWAGEEAKWYDKMMNIIVKRNRQSQPIKDFGD